MKHAAKKSCTATKRDGTGSQAAALPGSQFCFFHHPAKAAARRKAQSAGGRENRMRTLPADAPDVKAEDGARVVKHLAETINQVRRGEIDPRVANAVGYSPRRCCPSQKQSAPGADECKSREKSRAAVEKIPSLR